MQPTALFFDLDNTLIDDDASVQRAIEMAYTDLNLLHLGPADTFATALRALSDAYWESPGSKSPDLRESRLRFWREALTAHGCEDEGIIVAAVESYAAYRLEPATLFDDAIEVLETLQGRVPLAIVTNGQAEQQRQKLHVTGLARYFELVVAIDDTGFSKPHEAIFRHALDKMSLTDPAAVWHIGDSLANDITGAHNAGLRSVWLNRNGKTRAAHHPEPHHEIASLRELAALLE